MLRYILRKMISKKWLFIALLIGNILLTGIAASNPLYADAVMQRMLTDDMDAYLTKKNAYPGLVSVFFNGSVKKNGLIKENEALAHAVPADFGVPARMEVRRYFTSPMQNQPLIDDAKISSIGLGALEDVAAHARIVAGRMFDSERRADGTVEVIVSQRALVELNLLMGERREFPKLTDADGQPIVIEVVGVYDVSDVEDPYWVRSPSSYKSECLLDFDLFNRLFVREDLPVALSGCWYELLDAEQMSARNAQALYETALKYQEMGKNRQYLTVTVAFSDILKNHISQARRVRVTLWVLQAPIYILLAAFVFMVSRQILETEEAEISVLKSRGVSGDSFDVSFAKLSAGAGGHGGGRAAGRADHAGAGLGERVPRIRVAPRAAGSRRPRDRAVRAGGGGGFDSRDGSAGAQVREGFHRGAEAEEGAPRAAVLAEGVSGRDRAGHGAVRAVFV